MFLYRALSAFFGRCSRDGRGTVTDSGRGWHPGMAHVPGRRTHRSDGAAPASRGHTAAHSQAEQARDWARKWSGPVAAARYLVGDVLDRLASSGAIAPRKLIAVPT
jgi:hypothetical protein